MVYEPHPAHGKSTRLAMANFGVSGEPMPMALVRSLLDIKRAAASVNCELGVLDAAIADAIIEACDRVATEVGPELFPVDVFQTGSGTSTNMNVNEVIAYVAGERIGRPVHPNDHVNLSQSSNDVIPSALRMAALSRLDEALLPALDGLADTLDRRARDLADVVKAGRTHLMDATPVTLGQELGGYASQVREATERLRACRTRVARLPLGGTATGTGINTPANFGAVIAQRLAESTGLPLTEAPDHFAVQGGHDAIVELSGQVRTAAVALFKIANDLRLLGSGPRTGLAELRLPELQPGSSIMPGKVNPIICEVVTQVAIQVIGNDAAVAFAGTQGQLELNTYLPLLARNVLASIDLLANASQDLATKCVAGLEANVAHARHHADATLAAATALNPVLGYDVTTELVIEASLSGRTLREVVLARELVAPEALDVILDPLKLADPHGRRLR